MELRSMSGRCRFERPGDGLKIGQNAVVGIGIDKMFLHVKLLLLADGDRHDSTRVIWQAGIYLSY